LTTKPPITDLAHTQGSRDQAMLASTDAKPLRETIGDPEVDGFAIDLSRDHDGWKASSKPGPYYLEATGRTPAQALRGLARIINRHLYRHRRARPVVGDLTNVELSEVTFPPTSTITKEG
jgi:hypothetical protein